MSKKFKKGQLAESDDMIVLVTGNGSRAAGYPCFAGTVIKQGEESEYPVGMHSYTWTREAFELSEKIIVVRKG